MPKKGNAKSGKIFGLSKEIFLFRGTGNII
jgi:hypothetical protein